MFSQKDADNPRTENVSSSEILGKLETKMTFILQILGYIMSKMGCGNFTQSTYWRKKGTDKSRE